MKKWIIYLIIFCILSTALYFICQELFGNTKWFDPITLGLGAFFGSYFGYMLATHRNDD